MTVSLRPLGRVLGAREAGLYSDAAAALALAESQVVELRAAARNELEAERRLALDQARAEGEAEAARLLARTAVATQAALSALPLELAEAIAEGVAKVVGGMDLAEAVARAAQRALADLAERNGVVVRVAPEAVGATRTRLSASFGQTASFVQVVPDADLPADGCVLETRAGFVRAGLADQLAALAVALRGGCG